jgi:hypothetical protein
MATQTRYADIKRWAEATDRRSIQLWMPKEAVRRLDQLCRERKVGRAELLDSLISAASGVSVPDPEAQRA